MQSINIRFANRNCILADPSKYPLAADKANSYTCPRGPHPGRAFVLMHKPDVDGIRGNGINEAYPLEFFAGNKAAKFPKMYWHLGHNVSGGHTSDKDRVYMCELVDKREILRMCGCTKQYNLRVPAPPDNPGSTVLSFHAESLNGGVAVWTWQQVIADLWALLPNIAGATPTLPVTPVGSPIDLQFFEGVLDAIEEIANKVQCTLAYDPIADTFSLVKLGATQNGLAAIVNGYTNLYLDDADPISGAVTRAPETIRVCFHRVDKHYGTERTTPRLNNWLTGSVWVEPVATGTPGAVVNTSITLWDDLPAVADFSGTVTNTADLTARANQVAAAWLVNAGQSHGRRLYQGICPEFRPGSELESVCWRNFSDGFCTEILKKPIELNRSVGRPGIHRENYARPDLARRTFPHYPPVVNLVEIDDDEETANGLFSGVICRINPETGNYSQHESVWIDHTDQAVAQVIDGERYLGRLQGTASDGAGDYRPLYVVQKGGSGAIAIAKIRESAPTDVGFFSVYLQTAAALNLPDTWDDGDEAWLCFANCDHDNLNVVKDIRYFVVAAGEINGAAEEDPEDVRPLYIAHGPMPHVVSATLSGSINSGSFALAVRHTDGETFTVYDTDIFITPGEKITSGARIWCVLDFNTGKWNISGISECSEEQ